MSGIKSLLMEGLAFRCSNERFCSVWIGDVLMYSYLYVEIFTFMTNLNSFRKSFLSHSPPPQLQCPMNYFSINMKLDASKIEDSQHFNL